LVPFEEVVEAEAHIFVEPEPIILRAAISGDQLEILVTIGSKVSQGDAVARVSSKLNDRKLRIIIDHIRVLTRSIAGHATELGMFPIFGDDPNQQTPSYDQVSQAYSIVNSRVRKEQSDHLDLHDDHLDNEIERIDAELQGVIADIALAQARLTAQLELLAKGHVSKLDVLETEHALISTNARKKVLELTREKLERQKKLWDSRDASQSTPAGVARMSLILQDLRELRQQVLEAEILAETAELGVVMAPVSGEVLFTASEYRGTPVSRDEIIVTLLPESSRKIAVAHVDQEFISAVFVGQEAALEFPEHSEHFGVLKGNGTVERVSAQTEFLDGMLSTRVAVNIALDMIKDWETVPIGAVGSIRIKLEPKPLYEMLFTFQ